MEELLLSFGDLPLHPLLVHFAVALYPVSLLLLITTTISQRLRSNWIGKSVMAVAATVPFVFLAQQSGEALAEVMYEPEPHEEFGERMMPVALATLAVATLFWLAVKNGWNQGVSRLLGFLVVTSAIGAIALTIVVGHSGAAATWTGILP